MGCAHRRRPVRPVELGHGCPDLTVGAVLWFVPFGWEHRSKLKRHGAGHQTTYACSQWCRVCGDATRASSMGSGRGVCGAVLDFLLFWGAIFCGNASGAFGALHFPPQARPFAPRRVSRGDRTATFLFSLSWWRGPVGWVRVGRGRRRRQRRCRGCVHGRSEVRAAPARTVATCSSSGPQRLQAVWVPPALLVPTTTAAGRPGCMPRGGGAAQAGTHYADDVRRTIDDGRRTIADGRRPAVD